MGDVPENRKPGPHRTIWKSDECSQNSVRRMRLFPSWAIIVKANALLTRTMHRVQCHQTQLTPLDLSQPLNIISFASSRANKYWRNQLCKLPLKWSHADWFHTHKQSIITIFVKVSRSLTMNNKGTLPLLSNINMLSRLPDATMYNNPITFSWVHWEIMHFCLSIVAELFRYLYS